MNQDFLRYQWHTLCFRLRWWFDIMTVTFLSKTELLQDNEKNKIKWERIKDEDWNKMRLMRSRWDKTKCILTWWCITETKIHLNHIWIKFERNAFYNDEALSRWKYLSHT